MIAGGIVGSGPGEMMQLVLFQIVKYCINVCTYEIDEAEMNRVSDAIARNYLSVPGVVMAREFLGYHSVSRENNVCRYYTNESMSVYVHDVMRLSRSFSAHPCSSFIMYQSHLSKFSKGQNTDAEENQLLTQYPFALLYRPIFPFVFPGRKSVFAPSSILNPTYGMIS